MDPLSEPLSARISLSEIDAKKFPRPAAGERKRFLLSKSEEYEVVLMIWGPGAATPIHDHGGSRSSVEILDGAVAERIFDKAGPQPKLIEETILRTGDTSQITDGEVIHQMVNVSDNFSYSVHMYADPLSLCNIYDEDASEWFRNVPCYDQVST